ncbi:unnamed protein product, partial [Rotaria magnacalcarata]
SRRMHLRANQTSLELSEESADNTSLQQQKQPTLLQQQQQQQQQQEDQTDRESQIEEKRIIDQNLTQQSSLKTSPHIEY